MIVKDLPAEQAVGHVLMRNLVGSEGRKLLSKGRKLEATDLPLLRSAGIESVQAAVVEAGDLREDEAAGQVARLLAGAGLQSSPPRDGRVDLHAGTGGVFEADPDRLLELNALPGIGISTLRSHAAVSVGQRVATVKVVPYALPGSTVEEARRLCRGAPLLFAKPFVVRSAVLVTTGPQSSRGELAEAFGDALRRRLTAFGVDLALGPHAVEEEVEIRSALEGAASHGAGIILVAGKTSITDEDDLTPRAIRSAGGDVLRHGLPVEPGSLLLLAYRGTVPIVGLPGCARGDHRNAFDLLLPRLLAGERLSARELAALGHGGLLD